MQTNRTRTNTEPCFLYATSITFPSKLANRRQIVRQARAFADAGRSRVIVLIARGKADVSDEPFECVEVGSVRLISIALRSVRVMRASHVTHLYCREIRLFAILLLFRTLGLIPARVHFTYEVHRLSQPEKLDSWLLRKCLPRADAVVSVNGWMRDQLARGDATSGLRVLVAHDAADPAVFGVSGKRSEARRLLNISEHQYVAVYTGRFRTMGMDKGIDSTLRTLRGVAEILPHVRFYAIGGTDDELRDYGSLARDVGAEPYVTFLSYRSQEEVALYHAAADVLLMPFPRTEHFAYYMSPLKLFEYLMAGRPVIATRLPAIEDVLDDGNAILIEPDDTPALAEALIRIGKDPALRERLGAAALTSAEPHTWDRRAAAILDFIGI